MSRAERYRWSALVNGRRVQTAASACLAASLLVLTGVATWSSFATNAAARTSQRSESLAHAYSDARFSVSTEESLERFYRLSPGPGVSDAHTAAHDEVDQAMQVIIAQGQPADRTIAADVQRRNAAYADATRQLFQAVDQGDEAAEERIDNTVSDPIFDSMQEIVYAQADRHEQDSAAAGERLLRVERVARWATSSAVGAGLLLIIVFSLLRRRYRRDNAEHGRRNAHQATHDALTGLPNRVLFIECLERELATAPAQGAQIAVALLDLDRFKEVNDTLGHPVGDLLLQQIGPRISAVLRPRDVLARLGGDEFAVLLCSDTTGEEALAEHTEVARRVVDVLRPPFVVDGVALVVEASAGLAGYPRDGDTGELLLQRADIAMYVAKTNHTDLAVYDRDHDHHDSRKILLLAELRSAAVRDELVLHYQPLIDVATGRVKGIEALVRWQHPTRGLLFPGDFIALAESSGFIHELTRSVLHRAVRDAKHWADSGLPLRVSVNISARCLLDHTLPEAVTEILIEAGLPTDALKLEITESAIIADPDRAQEVIARLHRNGIALSIDDFGTGYTSLAYLRDLPVQELKIDQSFVTGMLEQHRDAVIVRTVIELAQRLGLDSVAEGIEDEAVLARITALGCTTAQGFHFSRPLPAEELTRWLKRWNADHRLPPESRNPAPAVDQSTNA